MTDILRLGLAVIFVVCIVVAGSYAYRERLPLTMVWLFLAGYAIYAQGLI